MANLAQPYIGLLLSSSRANLPAIAVDAASRVRAPVGERYIVVGSA